MKTSRSEVAMNPFADQATFMMACGQTVGFYNPGQAGLYRDLVNEEHQELESAISSLNRALLKEGGEFNQERIAEVVDGCVDLIVVTIGLLHSLGIPPEAAWREVMQSNMSKIDPDTGLVKRREDGKILKPPGFKPPNLLNIVTEHFKESK